VSATLALPAAFHPGASTFSDAVPKVGDMLGALIVFFAVILAVFFLASRARGKYQTRLAVVIFLGPAVFLLFIGLVVPALETIGLSFKDPYGQKYVGLANYKWAFTDSTTLAVLGRTLVWLIIAPTAATGIGLLLAVLIDRMKRESIPKSLIFMPMAISFVGAAIIWKFVYTYVQPGSPQIGLLSRVVMLIGWKNPPNWLLWDPWNNLLLMVIMIWVQTGFAMVVLSAAIKAIPGDIIEAANLDGATGFRLFRTVTVPMIRNTLVVVLTTIIIAVLKIFDIVYTITGGNFNTQVLANDMYQQTFVQFNSGRGTTLAVILFVGVLPLMAYNVVQLRKERAN
jgi:alpha-glucoside transport system permease protein